MKKLSFIFITIILIAVLFFILELTLRLFGYGDSYPLAKIVQTDKGERYEINSDVTRRYFDLKDEIIPQAMNDRFDKQRRENSLRVICVGGSTTAGFPYDVNATFPFQLQFRLRNALLDHHVEVINLGISAVNSFTVLDLMPEILDLQPDVLIIYMGHNEFYGAYGAGSSQFLSNNRNLIFLHFFFKKNLRLYQLLENIIKSTGQFFSRPSENVSLMQTLARDREIRKTSDVYKMAAQNFSTNLNEIVSLAKEKEVKIFVSNLVSNLKDHQPFRSSFAKNINEQDTSFIKELLTKTKTELNDSLFNQAKSALKELFEIDTTYALSHFYAGKVSLLLADTLDALKHFEKARDYDVLRFRAPGFFNRVIKEIAKRNDVSFVDMEKIFKASSPSGIPGNNLFFEHLHPNFDGYRLMAQTFFEAMRKVQVISPPKPIVYQDTLLSPKNIKNILSGYRRQKGSVTDLDLEIGNLRNQVLTNRWPFLNTEEGFQIKSTIQPIIIGRLAYSFLKNEISWHEAHYQLAEYYIGQKDYMSAYHELRAVNLSFYENWVPHMKLGDLALLEENFAKAIQWYKSALDKNRQDQNLMIKLGQAYALAKQFDKSLQFLKMGLARDLKKPIFSDFQKANIYYFMALSYANKKNFKEAFNEVDNALKFNPQMSSAVKLKKQMTNYLSNESQK